MKRAVLLVLLAACGDDAHPDVPKHVFTTSAIYSANLGGLVGADQKCQQTADLAHLGGSYAAWLSSTSQDAIERLNDLSPWTLVDGRVAFPDKASLASHPEVQLDLDEKGNQTFACVWTGTLAGGTKAPSNCSNWTSTIDTGGGVMGTGEPDSRWTDDPSHGPCGSNACGSTFRLYCFAQ